MTKPNRGFTLIELIVVILILGILAAIAAPKFVDLTGQARAAALKGMLAAVSSAATLANALQVAQGFTADQSVTVEGATVLMKNRYPSQASGGIDAVVRFDTVTFETAAPAMTFRVKTASVPATCAFLYNDAASTTVPPVIGPANTAGC